MLAEEVVVDTLLQEFKLVVVLVEGVQAQLNLPLLKQQHLVQLTQVVEVVVPQVEGLHLALAVREL
jgi:hypothetical protein